MPVETPKGPEGPLLLAGRLQITPPYLRASMQPVTRISAAGNVAGHNQDIALGDGRDQALACPPTMEKLKMQVGCEVDFHDVWLLHGIR